MTLNIPTSATVLVIGGGPAGSYTATVLAQEGIKTVLLELEHFPRYHVGESMLPSLRHFLQYVGADDKFKNHGFKKKVGAAFQVNHKKRPGFTNFLEIGPEAYSWNVVRSEADEILLRHAQESGVEVFEGIKVESIDFEDEKRPRVAHYVSKDTGEKGQITFDYVVDASGRQGVLSTKYFHNRVYNKGLRNIATWGYWKGCGVYEEGTERAHVPYFEALQDESGWAWFIPLHNDVTSVGLVMTQDSMNAKKRSYPNGAPTSEQFYVDQLNCMTPNILKLIKDGKMQSGEVRVASDFSYSAPTYAGPHYRLVGDAGAFIDPFFSSGVHLALTSGLSAAATICASIRGDCDEATAATWHSDKFAASYTRFLVVVLAAYRQVRNQEVPVISDVDEDNFDKAFGFFKPVIQGVVDVNKGVSKDIIAKTVEFCAEAFNTERVAAHVAPIPTLDGDVNIELSKDISVEEQAMLQGIMLRRQMRPQDTMGIGAFTTDVIGGLHMEMQKGALGLRHKDVKVAAPEGLVKVMDGAAPTPAAEAPAQSVEVSA
ncbi:FAD/NAD(P)-binding domain-containing protein [Schizopora paradoxa]|uniref:FAD/NAD(P)-binding domain-containing protein n=1 Tax=Schizopora paradoxa TaxID=27342 RepID=A0A0H2S8K1_9AGAM|nr:FAD/NAD(P)-binding domain-containing protein [Schizopora paradoxa]